MHGDMHTACAAHTYHIRFGRGSAVDAVLARICNGRPGGCPLRDALRVPVDGWRHHNCVQHHKEIAIDHLPIKLRQEKLRKHTSMWLEQG